MESFAWVTLDGWGVTFPVSGVHTLVWLPPLAAFVISFFTAMGGVSGAFLLLPLQMAVFGFVSPAASATNMVFNLVATPSGIWRYAREGRLALPLALLIMAGALPGVVIGYFLRVGWLAEPARFRLFVAAVLLYLAWRLLAGVRDKDGDITGAAPPDHGFSIIFRGWRQLVLLSPHCSCQVDVLAMLALSGVVGVAGGAYGIGGGAIIAPFCVIFFRLPVHWIAGAALLGTFVTSAAGVVVYSLLPAANGQTSPPDWPLGLLFGLGGAMGMYAGATAQKYFSHRSLRLLLGMVILLLAIFQLTTGWFAAIQP